MVAVVGYLVFLLKVMPNNQNAKCGVCVSREGLQTKHKPAIAVKSARAMVEPFIVSFFRAR